MQEIQGPGPITGSDIALDNSCMNCGTLRLGPYCHGCGQHAHDWHRSLRRLLAEGARLVTESDGPLLRTIRRLIFHPARLTTDYLNGKRASQVSPVRLFLVSLALVLIVTGHEVIVQFGTLTPQQAATMPRLLMALSNYIHAHGVDFLHSMHESAEVFAFFTVPIAALLLKLVYLNRQGFTLYDHAVFAGYSLSFQMLMLAIILSLPDSFGVLAWVVFLAMCVHLFAQLRGVYGGNIVAVLFRMAALAVLSFIAYLLLLLCWVAAAALMLAA